MHQLYYFGLIIQCIVLYGGIDLNFKSSLQSNLTPVKATENPPAKRIVLFVADGLRNERLTAFIAKNLTPWLKDIKYNRGASGISIASVPTESRPGHVAIFAGIYEDPSALFKGWQDNPVNFDSVINQSANAFGWGSPDILNLFNKENHPHVHFHTYDRDMQDFNKPAIELDRWVLDNVEKKFNSSKDKCDDFCGSKTVFFLHLLGMDNAGHAYKPHSKKYVESLIYLDALVKRVEGHFQSFFADNKTTFIFTADHGMTNWGSHGSGSDDETNVPVLAWGAGISKGKKHIINQNDFAPFMSALIGINIPTNSLGRLPAEYFDVDLKTLAEMMFANTQQFAALYSRLENSKKAVVGFKPFPLLNKPGLLDKQLNDIKQQIKLKNYSLAMNSTRVLMNILEGGRKYYLDYHKNVLIGCLVVALHVWFICLITSCIDRNGGNAVITLLPNIALYAWIILIILLCIALSFVFMSSLPFTAYLYVSLPFLCTALLLFNYKQVFCAIHAVRLVGGYKFVLQCIVYGVGLVLLTSSFTNRSYLVPILFAIGFWGCYKHRNFTQTDKIIWCVLCFIVSIFALLPAVKNSGLITHGIGSVLWLFVTVVVVKVFDKSRSRNFRLSPLNILLGVFVVCLVIGFCTRFQETIPVCINLYCWYLLGVITVLPFFVQPTLHEKLITWLLAFMSYYALVSVQYELLFMLVYCILLGLWITLEDKLTQFSVSSLREATADVGQQLVRRSFFYLTFALLGFFGTGNFAELSSFDPMWVKPLITSFNPFIITALIVVKISIPLMMCTIAVYTINRLSPGKSKSMFTIMLAFCEIMLMAFLVNIRTEGSWLEIGTSLSKFIVCGVLTLVLMIYYQLANALMLHSFV